MPVSVTVVGSRDRQLEELLRASGMRVVSISTVDLAVLAQPGSAQPHAIVLDQRDETALPPALSLLKRQHPSTGIVVVASRLDPALMLEAMRAGVNECVTDPLTQADLEDAVKRVLSQRPSATGQVFAFLGAKGGVGTTTVAVNVATCLAKASASGTLLIDLHLAYGDAALFLGAEPRFSVVDALENTHRLDEAYFRGLVVHSKAGPDLLASSDHAVVRGADVRRVRALIEFAAQHYGFVVLDCPRSDAAVLEALESVSAIVIVANQELATVRSASRMAVALRLRYGKDRVSVVVSRYDTASEIGHDDLERVVGGSVKHLFPSDYRQSVDALNKGRPLVLENHNKLAGSLTAFAHKLAGLKSVEKDKPERPSGGLFGRLTGRR